MDYVRRWNSDPARNPNLIYFLGDRYEYCRTWSAISGAIPTYRKNSGKFLNRGKMTFLSTLDKLASLGWPCTPEVAAEMGTTPVPALDPQRADVLAGNSMHLTCAAVVLMLGVTCFGKVTDKDDN